MMFISANSGLQPVNGGFVCRSCSVKTSLCVSSMVWQALQSYVSRTNCATASGSFPAVALWNSARVEGRGAALGGGVFFEQETRPAKTQARTTIASLIESSFLIADDRPQWDRQAAYI